MIVGILGHSGSGKDTMAKHLSETHRLIQVAFADPLKRFCQTVFEFSDEQLWGGSDSRNAPDERYMGSLSAAQQAERRLWEAGPGFIDELLGHLPARARLHALRELWNWFDGCVNQPDLSPRFALQTLGTEWGRDISPNIWVDYAFEKIIPAITSGDYTYTRERGLMKLSPTQRYIWPVFGPPRGVVLSDMRFPNEVAIGREKGCFVVRLRRTGKDGKISGGVTGHRSEALQKEIPDNMLDAVLNVPEGIPQYHRAIDQVMKTMVGRRRQARLTA
jgi:hypothetical protein